jgi:hypothetical protein
LWAVFSGRYYKLFHVYKGTNLNFNFQNLLFIFLELGFGFQLYEIFIFSNELKAKTFTL